MLCLGIESSCDDTCVALLDGATVIAHAASSQIKLHALFGGVVPEVASREHAKRIGLLCRHVFEEGRCNPKDVGLVAVTRGPGLLGSLLVGVSFAKSFALGMGIPIIGVDHLHAHLLVAALEHSVEFPALGLLVSGGHTLLCRIEDPKNIKVLGRTLDDAAGEAFDKAGKMLGLPYPAGRHIDELSRKGVCDNTLFPRPYLNNDTLDFSFSGLKTAMQSHLSLHPLYGVGFDPLTGELIIPKGQEQLLYDLCASYTGAVVDTLKIKTARALALQEGIRSVILAGGVAANSFLRDAIETLAKEHGVAFYAPRLGYCADNAVMVAYLGSLLYTMGYKHDLAFEAIPRGRGIPNDMISIDSLA